MVSLKSNIIFTIAGAILVISLLFISSCNKSEIPKKDVPDSNPYGFKNINNNVKYVGDEECYDCHSGIYNTFKKNGMGRSFYLPNDTNMIEDFQNNNVIYDKKSNYYYRMYKSGNDYYQMEYRTDEKGNRTHELVRKIDYVIGSGNQTRSYITQENGFLYEMPATWYTIKKKWDLSPGYQNINYRFSRPIRQECLNCHNSYADYVEYSDNRYTGKIPLGIGCERCHGPGELHVKHQEEKEKNKEEKIDSTIVNSGHLDSKLQFDVCLQCHLQGDMHVLKEGKKQNDFKPGMSLNEVKGYYFHGNIKEGEFKVASHGARLMMSKCFIKSGGKLVCTTCHNPHESVKDIKRRDMNDKCKACHEIQTLSVSNSKANHTESGDCISCHMKQGGAINVPHVNFTDHWIRKEIQTVSESEVNSLMEDKSSSEKTPVTLKEFNNSDDKYSEINLAIAYIKYYEEKHNLNNYLELAIPVLERGTYNYPEHKNALYYLGKAYFHHQKYQDAERCFKKLIKLDSTNADAFYLLGSALEKLNKFGEAIEALRNSISVFPENYKAYNSLGNIYSNINNTNKAIESYNQSIKILSNYTNAFNNLGDVYLNMLNDTAKARIYFEFAIKYDPDFTMALLNLGNLYSQSNFNTAKSIFESIIKIDPKFTPAYGNLAYLFSKQGKNKEAIAYLNKLLEIDSNDIRAKNMLKELSQKK
ncbi:MAG TPA: tetratricopeptide repeat protein [Ignavibacteria bacterium]